MPLLDRIIHPFKNGDHHDERRGAHEEPVLNESLTGSELHTSLHASDVPPSTVVEAPTEVVTAGNPVEVPLPGIEQPAIVKQVKGPEVEIHQTHVEQPIVHETHTHKDVVHEHHINQEIVHERHIEQPIIVEKHIERPVVHEKHIERPVIHEKHFEKAVIHEKHIEQPVIHEKHIDKPIVHEQHIVVPIIHEQHIVKPIIHEVHVTQVVTDLVLPTQTTPEQLTAAISSAASEALGQAGVTLGEGNANVVFDKAEVRVEQQSVPLATTQNQAPPMVVQNFDHPVPPIVNADGTTELAPLPVGASSVATVTQPPPLVFSDDASSAGTSVLTSTETTDEISEKSRSKKGKKRGHKRFFFFRKH